MTMPPKPPNPIDVHVGERIRMWRTERKISRITLGDAIGLTDQQIGKYENGTNRIGASRLRQICNVLKIPVSLLFEDVPEPSPGEGGTPQDMIDFMESEEGIRFVAAFIGITDRKMRRGIARLTSRIADHMQPGAPAELLQFKEPVDDS
jgi:transcriptional regulator with XRE-family HTH domain